MSPRFETGHTWQVNQADSVTVADVLILGAGAAGLMCALVAGRRGRRVVVLERSNKPGKKILMSGGGRCNFTNLHTDPGCFLSRNPHFCKSALSRYTQWDFIDMVERHGISYHEKGMGQLFCDDSSRQILDMLLEECREAGVTLFVDCETPSVCFDGRYHLECKRGEFSARSLVVATGGLSIPKLGGSAFGYELARQFGLDVLPTRAGLAPLTFSGPLQEMFGRLSGLSLPVRITAEDGTSFHEHMLFTHRGLSGPAVLQISSYWELGQVLVVDLLPGLDASDCLQQEKRSAPKILLRTVLGRRLPRALTQELEALWWAHRAQVPLGEWSDRELAALAARLNAWELKPAGTEGYRTAEVTLGGVDTRQLSSRTMEAVARPGLYFIGEVVDVTGHLGGFNFQWAWSSGHAAGEAV